MTTDLIKKVISLYLYGTETPPSDLTGAALIRSDTDTVALNGLSAAHYMTNGGGRFAKASQFEVVNKFFDTSNALATGSYTLTQILSNLNLNTNAAIKSIDQKGYVTPFMSVEDYVERVLVFNNTSFSIENSHVHKCIDASLST